MSNSNPSQDSSGRFCAQTLREKFESKAIKRDGCWDWSGDKHKAGYGQLWHNGRKLRATHASWEIHNGPVPAGMDILHKCDNPPCANPDHLFVGDQGDNMQDKMLKMRAAKKLTATDVADIRSSYSSGISTKILAGKHDVSTVTILNVARRRTWRHL